MSNDIFSSRSDAIENHLQGWNNGDVKVERLSNLLAELFDKIDDLSYRLTYLENKEVDHELPQTTVHI